MNDSFDYLYYGYLILQLRHGKWDESVHWLTGHKLVIFYKEKHKVLNHYITKGKNIFKTLCKLGFQFGLTCRDRSIRLNGSTRTRPI